jgi:tRNA threonylcarbamoyladenosine biosynthesis protein TsaB
MNYLGIRTDGPQAEFYLFQGTQQLATRTWQADRQLARNLLRELESFLGQNNLGFHEVEGLFIYKGPGSFTGLRIGITTLNAYAYAREIPIVGVSGEKWIETALRRLMSGETDRIILPEYGADPRITKPKK